MFHPLHTECNIENQQLCLQTLFGAQFKSRSRQERLATLADVHGRLSLIALSEAFGAGAVP